MGCVTQIEAGQRWQYAKLVEGWGYPRRVSHREVETGHWFTDGVAVVWYTEPVEPGMAAPDGVDVDGVLAVHGIRDPVVKRQALTPRAAIVLEVIGELLGARKLYSLIPRETPNMPVQAMRRYLRRYGWVEDEFGSYKLLGGA